MKSKPGAPMWDAFLSHAGEDKDLFVRPVADRLLRLGVKVAYDEYTFRIGESLVQSIDDGIAKSAAGVLVLSEHFIGKPWPEHERRGLIQRLVQDDGFRLIPVWRGVTADDVRAFSPSLADRKAIISDPLTVDEVAAQILREVRPDLADRGRRLKSFLDISARSPVKMVAPQELEPGPIRYERLPASFVGRIRMIHSGLRDVQPFELDELLEMYQREAFPELEIAFWERVCTLYLEASAGLAPTDPERKRIYRTIFALAMGLEPKEEDLPAEVSMDRIRHAADFRARWERPPNGADDGPSSAT